MYICICSRLVGLVSDSCCGVVCPIFSAYNDYQLHTFCMTYHGLLGQYMLPPTCLMASGKLVALDALLKELKAKGSRPLIFSQVRGGAGRFGAAAVFRFLLRCFSPCGRSSAA